MRSRTSWSLALMPEPGGFGQRGFLFDQPLEDPLVDAQLPQHLLVHVGAVGLPVGLHLPVVDAAEAVDRDLAALDAGDDVARGGAAARRRQVAGM